MCIVLYVGINFMDWLEKEFYIYIYEVYVYIYEKNFEVCITYDAVWLSWGDPVQLTDIKIQLITNQ